MGMLECWNFVLTAVVAYLNSEQSIHWLAQTLFNPRMLIGKRGKPQPGSPVE